MKTKHIGSTLDAFLAEEGLLEAATANAVKRVSVWQIKQQTKNPGRPALAEKTPPAPQS